MSVSELIKVTCPGCKKKYGINPVHIKSDKGIIKCKACQTDIPVHKSMSKIPKAKPEKPLRKEKKRRISSKQIPPPKLAPDMIDDPNDLFKKDLPNWAEEIGGEMFLDSPPSKNETEELITPNLLDRKKDEFSNSSNFLQSKDRLGSEFDDDDEDEDLSNLDFNNLLSDDSNLMDNDVDLFKSKKPSKKKREKKRDFNDSELKLDQNEEMTIASVLRDSDANGALGDIDIDLSTPSDGFSGFNHEDDDDDDDPFFENMDNESGGMSFSGEDTIIQEPKENSYSNDEYDVDFSDWSDDPILKGDKKSKKTKGISSFNNLKHNFGMEKNPLTDSKIMDSPLPHHPHPDGEKSKKFIGLSTRMIFFVIIPLITIAIATLVLSLHSMVSIQKENLKQSMQIIKDINESLISQISASVANQTRLFLMNQPYLTKENFNRDIYFKKIVLQKIGNKGFTSLYEIAGADDSWKIWAHFAPAIVGKNLKTFRNQLNQDFIDFWRIISGVREGKVTKGYTKWPDKTGQFKKAFLVCTPIEGTQYAIASCFFLDEIQAPLNKIEASNKGASEKMRSRIGLIMVIGVFSIGIYLFFFGQKLAERIKRLRTQVDQINAGGNDFRIITSSSNDEIGQLSKSIGEMQKNMQFRD